VLSAASEVDLYNQLLKTGLELISCDSLNKNKGFMSNLGMGKKIVIRDLIQLFLHLEQMQGAGVSLLDSLGDIRDTTEHDRLRDIMTEIHRDVSEGSSLSEAMALHPKVFKNLFVSLVGSGEETGDMTAAYAQLIKYLKWVDQMQQKVRKATRYPIILVVVVVLTITIMLGLVVPQIVGFIENLDQELPVYTTSLMATSEFVKTYWWAIIAMTVAIPVSVIALRKSSEEMAYRVDLALMNSPVAGPLIRKINIARFAQTFGALYSSGIDILSALEAARKTVSNVAISDALGGIIDQVRTGSPLSEAFNASGEFPSMVVRMLKVGEESGRLTPVLEQVSEFYTSDVDEAIQGLIAMIEPLLTGLLGIMILWIAVAVFGPIYSSFGDMDF
jgi:type IV pilus assembly protein PilC